MTDFNNPLIFGKNTLQNVVSMEIQDGHAEVFVQQSDGSVRSEFIQNRYWLLSDQNHGGFTKLKGDLHYKYGKQFDTAYQFNSAKQKLKRYDIYKLSDFREQFMVNKGVSYFKGLAPKDLSVLSFDIETTGINHDDSAKLLIIANTFRNPKGQIYRKLFCYDEYDSEGDMLNHWVNWVRKLDPTVICGHNIIDYDLPYMRFIADRAGVSLDLGRDGSRLNFYPYTQQFRVDGNRDQEYTNIRCYGREIIDTMFLAMRYDGVTKKYPSYKLKEIIKFEGLEVENRQFYEADTIRHNYTKPEEWKKIKKYAENDGDDALALFDLMIPAYFYMNQSVPKTFQQMILSASGAQLNSILVRSYLQEGHSISKADDRTSFQGAISYGNPGIHRNVFKIDVASLYPSIILQFKIWDKIKDPNGNLLKLVAYWREGRLKNKELYAKTGEKYYQDLSEAFKVFINSIYGLLGTPGLNFNNMKLAAEVTRHGREILQTAINWAIGRKLIFIKIPAKTPKGKDSFEWIDPVNFVKDSMELVA